MAGTGTAHLRDDALLEVEDLVVEYRGRKHTVHAVSGVSLDVRAGETLGLVGESGCGKSTMGRAILRLQEPTAGSVRLDGISLGELGPEEMRRLRPRLQLVFQDPISSLNPRRSVFDIVAEPLRIWGWDETRIRARVRELLDAVGLDADLVGDRKAHQFSGGQCQRISIARALALEPDVLVCDEPVSALDVSVQAQILAVLHDLRERLDLTMLMIAHDLAVVRNVSDRVAVMYLGKLCEVGDTEELYARPAHPYTATLLAAVPVPDPEVAPPHLPIPGELPSPANPPSGCRFRTRCPLAQPRCAEEEPTMQRVGPGHHVACHYPLRGGEGLPEAPDAG